ncbi:MAG TPA: alpha/beta hydrolase-fold protein [Vicinamibacterales bacterium]|nr:alpha/beta hydrolase-fold protein [Vicinamibacterales bacterium]
MTRLLSALAVLLLCACTLARAQTTNVDAAFSAFWAAKTPQEAARSVPKVLESRVTFDDALSRLKVGRPYAEKVPKGVVRRSYDVNGVEYFYALNVPDSYDPARRYQVRIQLHGGVGREGNGPRGDGTIGALAGAEQIYIIPYAWREAPWWSDEQIASLGTILDSVKRTYNVDENRVALAGVSDGGTGAFYVALRAPTPFASFLSLNGFVMVLASVVKGDLFPNNFRNKPFFIVNGGMDPLYPTRIVEPFVRHLDENGVELMYRPQPNGVHNTAWWPDVKDSFETFVRNHPRRPLPDVLTWETSGTAFDDRVNWLVIDRLAPRSSSEERLADLNFIGPNRILMFENGYGPSGRVDLVRTGNTVKATTRGVAAFTLLLSPEMFDFSQPLRVEANGKVVFEGRVERSVATLMKWAARDNDRSMLFAAELPIRVP